MIPAVMPTYRRAEIAFERGEGAYLFATDGRRYLDFASGIAVTALGHAHPHLVAALTEQAKKLWHTVQPVSDPRPAAAGRAAGGGELRRQRVLLQFRRRGDRMRPQDGAQVPRRDRHIPSAIASSPVEGAFHGRTLATIAAGGQEKHLKGFDPIVDGFDQVAFGNLNEMRAADHRRDAAILVEPVQGEGGMRAGVGRVSAGAARGRRRVRPAAVLRRGAIAAWAAPASCSPMNGRASSPISWRPPRGSAAAFPWAPAWPRRRWRRR